MWQPVEVWLSWFKCDLNSSNETQPIIWLNCDINEANRTDLNQIFKILFRSTTLVLKIKQRSKGLELIPWLIFKPYYNLDLNLDLSLG